ncbi:MAG: hypothetical protein KDE27_08330 [Planctomycetes bacterium]|nr:hypothetical protein [Planctomycetota bacterium]
MNQSTILVAALALAASAPAQTPMGTFTNTGTTSATRGNSTGAANNNVTVFTRHDKENYAGWTDGVQPGTREIVGINFVLQDQNLATQHNFNLVLLTGDPNNPKFPDLNSSVIDATPYVLPVGTGIGAFNGIANFATPVSLSANEDIYVGLRINSPWTLQNGQPVDGLSVWELRGTAPVSPMAGQAWDLPGRSLPNSNPADRPSGYYLASSPAAQYPVRTQFKLQPILPISGGVAGAVTNQTDHPQSSATSVASFEVQAPGAGTASMFSGLYPDARNPPYNPGRVDEISQMFENAALSAGSVVFFLIDIGSFAQPEVAFAAFVPGSTGVSCLNLSQQNLGFRPLVTVGTTQRAHHVATFPPAARSLLLGIPWTQQAVALDIGTNTLHASACTRQRT